MSNESPSKTDNEVKSEEERAGFKVGGSLKMFNDLPTKIMHQTIDATMPLKK